MNSRDRMIKTIRNKYKLDAPDVLAAMEKVPRDHFVLPKYKKVAFDDTPVPIGYGQTMSQPYTVAFMTSLLSLRGEEKVLEVGTGSGYQAAVLSYMVREVYSVEIIPQLAKRARETLRKLNYKNIFINHSSGEWGWEEHAPFDAIIVTAGLNSRPPAPLFDQLKDGGVLVAPVGKGERKEMIRYTKSGRKVKKESFGSFQFVPFVKDKN